MSQTRRLVCALLLGAALAGAALSPAGLRAAPQAAGKAAPQAATPANAPAEKPAVTAGDSQAAAPATEPIDAEGLRRLLGTQRGKVVVLNLWATWCVPCLREIPDLVALEQELGPRGVVLLGLGMDEPSALAAQVEPFRRKHFPAFRTWLRSTPDMDTLVSVVDPAWNEILPTTYLIGRDGKVAKKIQGKRTLEQFRELIKEVP